MKHRLPRLLRSLVLTAALSPVAAMAMTSAIEVYHDPSCGCCVNWIRYMESQGYTVNSHEEPAMAAVKTRLGVPADAASCHTAKIGGYVIEGHVPAEDIQRLLTEHPDARGLAAPGMPMGSPGMEMAAPQHYDVVLIGKDGTTRVFASHGPKA
ncbi:DUF411 domain-containing protein [Rhodanobacter caeni]|uniref:Metal-binding protein n=1 Tax=Rhodanobacter caeni TaxID=657654 RepID=A0ABN0UC28_9GAMM